MPVCQGSWQSDTDSFTGIFYYFFIMGYRFRLNLDLLSLRRRLILSVLLLRIIYRTSRTRIPIMNHLMLPGDIMPSS